MNDLKGAQADYEKAIEYQKRYNVDAIMIGRAAIGNPWIFQQIKY